MQCPRCGYKRINYTFEYFESHEQKWVSVFSENGYHCGVLKVNDLSEKTINVIGGDSGYTIGENSDGRIVYLSETANGQLAIISRENILQ